MDFVRSYSSLNGHALTAMVGVFIALPIIAALWFGISTGGGSTWDHILHNRLLPYTVTTIAVLLLTGAFVTILAIPAAWLVSMHEFPGRAIFEWLLILPLAMPGYVMAYAWADLAGVAGPLQSTLRQVTGLTAREYWFPDIFSIPGLALILASTLFPYVYITTRAAFTTQSLATLEVARSLGLSGTRLFMQVALPAARTAIIAGLSLALMEAAADFGAADYLGIPTLGVGIVRAWSSYGEPATAARLALVLISIAFTFIILARALQGSAGNQQTTSRWLSPTRAPLTGAHRLGAIAFCTLILIATFALPLSRLIWLSLESGRQAASILPALTSSLILGLAGTTLAFIAAIILVLGTRHSNRIAWFARLTSTAGYAAPGVVLGLGALLIMKASGQPLTGALALMLLVWIYASRFTAAGIEPLRAAFERAPKSLDFATRSLGVTGLRRFWTVDLPLVLPGALAGGLILFVEILKELPATLMLRPFGWDTLAVRAHAYASDERLADATLPSLLITLAGLGPVLLLSWRLSHTGRNLSP